jgi:hypothetical protein
MATGALNANGVWIYGEDDSETTFSALLNKLGNSVSGQLGAGHILQVKMFSYGVTTFSNTTSYANTGLSGTITLSKSTNKVLAIVNQSGLSKEQADTWGRLRLVREIPATSITQLAIMEGQYSRSSSTGFNVIGSSSMTWLDSPGSTATLTYRTEFNRETASGFVGVQYGGATSTLTLIEVRG